MNRKFMGIFLFILFIYISLWLFIEIDLPAINDSFELRNLVDQNEYFKHDISRFFGLLPTFLANLIDQNGFIGSNVLLITFNTIRVFLFFLILQKIINNTKISFFIALLYSVMPTDSSYFWQGALGMHFGIVTFLYSIYLFISSKDVADYVYRRIYIFASYIVMFISVFTYRGYYLLLVLFSTLWFFKYKNKIIDISDVSFLYINKDRNIFLIDFIDNFSSLKNINIVNKNFSNHNNVVLNKRIKRLINKEKD